jgi:hypothetical protein
MEPAGGRGGGGLGVTSNDASIDSLVHVFFMAGSCQARWLGNGQCSAQHGPGGSWWAPVRCTLW